MSFHTHPLLAGVSLVRLKGPTLFKLTTGRLDPESFAGKMYWEYIIGLLPSKRSTFGRTRRCGRSLD
jgi:hypothetical protein